MERPCNRLLRDGATPYLEPADLFAHYPEVAFVPEPAAVADDGLRMLPDTLSAEERGVAELMGREAVPLERLVERAGRPVGALLAVLCGLELQGVVEQVAGRRFRRI